MGDRVRIVDLDSIFKWQYGTIFDVKFDATMPDMRTIFDAMKIKVVLDNGNGHSEADFEPQQLVFANPLEAMMKND